MKLIVAVCLAVLTAAPALAQDPLAGFHSRIIGGWYPSGTYVGPAFLPLPPIVVTPPPVVVAPPPIVVGPPPPLPGPPPVCAAVNWGPPLNLRTWPNGPVIAAYWAGTRVLIDGSNGGRWAHVIVGPVAGWMFAPYLTPLPCGV
jgi:hypothetical protein